MREQGVVTRVIPPDVVEVSLQASEACGRCGACHPDTEGRVGIEAVGVSGVKTGDVSERLLLDLCRRHLNLPEEPDAGTPQVRFCERLEPTDT